jgi:hypothetical protein
MNYSFVLFLLVCLFIGSTKAGVNSNSASGAGACIGKEDLVDDPKNKKQDVLEYKEILSCKSCYGEKCPHWNFKLKYPKETIEKLK